MSAIVLRILCLAIGYVFGLFQTAYLYGKAHGIDIRTVGSGNAGTTNALRKFGTKVGLLVLVCDILKCVLAIGVTWLLFSKSQPQMVRLLATYAGLGAVMGHCYPFYMQFKGGKGVACIAGIALALAPKIFLVAFIGFLVILALTHYVSLGSLLGLTFFLIAMIVVGQSGAYAMPQAYLTEMYVLIALLVAFVYFKHRSNIVRLIHGEERKTYLFHKNKV